MKCVKKRCKGIEQNPKSGSVRAGRDLTSGKCSFSEHGLCRHFRSTLYPSLHSSMPLEDDLYGCHPMAFLSSRFLLESANGRLRKRFEMRRWAWWGIWHPSLGSPQWIISLNQRSHLPGMSRSPPGVSGISISSYNNCFSPHPLYPGVLSILVNYPLSNFLYLSVPSVSYSHLAW